MCNDLGYRLLPYRCPGGVPGPDGQVSSTSFGGLGVSGTVA